MAKVFIVRILAISKGMIGVEGFLDNRLTDKWLNITADQIPYDPGSSTSIRQQIQDQGAEQVNAALTLAGHPEEANVVPSDIEFVS